MVYRPDSLDAAFGALADPTRRAILMQLTRGDRTIKELAGSFSITLPAVSKHVRVLEQAGLTVVRRDGRARRCQLVAAPLKVAAGWIDQYRRFWEASFDRLAAYLDASLTEEDPACLTPRPRRPSPRSKSAARSTPRDSASSTHGHRRKR